MAKMYGLVHRYKFEFGEKEEELLRIASGIQNVGDNSEEDIEEYYYLDGGGVAEEAINGSKMGWTFEGHREFSDPLQNLIFDELQYDLDRREGYLQITYPNGKVIKGPAKVSEIKDLDGDAENRTEISFNITFSGKPTVELGEVEKRLIDTKGK